jgi:hypothetical protein
MKKYSKDLNDGKLMKCIYCNAIYSPLCMARHYKTDYHLEQLCQKEYGMKLGLGGAYAAAHDGPLRAAKTVY